MGKILLIRHGNTDAIGNILAGRMQEVPLNDSGYAQARELASYLLAETITAIYSSPLERAVQTALPTSLQSGVPIRTVEALNEIEFGEWTGRKFEDLAADPAWQAFNDDRAKHCAPGGETMECVATRAYQFVCGLKAESTNGTLALFSHSDVIKSIVLRALSAPLQKIFWLDIQPCSITKLEFRWGQPAILSMGSVVR